MARRLSILLVALFALGFAVSGCGDDDDDKKSDDTGDTPAQTDTGGGATPTPPGTDTGGGDTSVPTSSDDAVEACKRGVESSSAPDDQKEAALKLCEAAAGRDIEQQRKAAGENCKKQAESLPSGASRDQALEACERLSGER